MGLRKDLGEIISDGELNIGIIAITNMGKVIYDIWEYEDDWPTIKEGDINMFTEEVLENINNRSVLIQISYEYGKDYILQKRAVSNERFEMWKKNQRALKYIQQYYGNYNELDL